MRFKTSCFNPALFLLNARRFWPVAVLVLAVVGVMPGLAIDAIFNDPGYSALEAAEQLQTVVYGSANLMVPLVAAAALLSGILAFRHIHRRVDAQFFLGLPVRATARYVTTVVSSLLLVALPLAVGLLVCAAGCASGGCQPAALACLRVLCAGLACELLFCGLATLSCVLSGNVVGSVLIYLGLNFTVMVVVMGAAYPAAQLMPGVQLSLSLDGMVEWLTPIHQLMLAVQPDAAYAPGAEAARYLGFSRPWALWAYAAVGAALLVASGALYRVRKAERAGETVAFRPVRTVCKVLFALVVAAIGSYVTVAAGSFPYGAPTSAVVVSVLVFAALGWFVAEAVVRQSLRVLDRASLAPCAAVLVVLLALMGAAKADVAGVVRFVPDAGQVRECRVDYAWLPEVRMDPQDAVLLHRAVVDNLDELGAADASRGCTSLNLRYVLQDGRTLERAYMVRDRDDDGNLQPGAISKTAGELLGRRAYALQALFGSGFEALSQETLDFCHMEWYEPVAGAGTGAWADLGIQEAMSLRDAVVEDVEAGRMSVQERLSGAESVGSVSMDWYDKPYDFAQGTYADYVDRTPMSHASFEVTPSMTSTCAWVSAHAELFQPDGY